MPNGLKPWNKKIDAILQLDMPKTVSDLHGFIGTINFYCDMWPHWAHFLAPLTLLTGKSMLEWTPAHQHAFKCMKALIITDTCLAFPDHNQPFHIYTDASDYQLGAVIMQNDCPVTYYTCKLSGPQQNYTTMEKELLSIIATLREFCTMLFGAEIHVHTNHKNLTYTNLNTQCILHWQLYIEEFCPQFHYIKGSDNILADFFSWAPLLEKKGTSPPSTSSSSSSNIFDNDSDIFENDKPIFENEKSHLTSQMDNDLDQPSATSSLVPTSLFSSTEILKCLQKTPEIVDCYLMDEKSESECFMSAQMLDAFLNVPPGPNPMDYAYIQQQQQNDNCLQQL